ncbi:MAG: hypothetical protein JNM56_11175 [Planctomycetia bacterium]|nr:hypothetical protein [Planctomycetia bacterium]
MLTTLALLTLLQLPPAQAGTLSLTGARVSHGVSGPTRADTKVLPGDRLCVTFDIDGITVDANGKVLYSVATEVADAKGKVIFRQPPRDLETINSLGGSKLPAFAQVDIGLEQPAGDYTLTVNVTDRANKKSQSLSQKFTVLPKGFGIIHLTTTADPDAEVPANLLGAGQSLWVNYAVVGFGRDTAKKQPNATMTLRVLDEKGKPTLAQPFTGTVDKDVPANATALPVQFLLSLNRPGKFTVEVTASCKHTGKTVTQSFPINVQAR